jgi:parallel beta-helix repeat protein
MRLLAAAFFLFVMIGFVSAGSMFCPVSASTDVVGIINSDTTWTASGSPCNLLGPVAVNNGASLTIEPGVTVNLNGHYIQVNGTLTARGSSNSKIQFVSGSIIFTTISTGWNEQTGSGSIIENSILTTTITVQGASPKITQSTFANIYISDGSPTVSYNTVNGEFTVAGGAPTVEYNEITNGAPGSLTVGAYAPPSIRHNTINGRIMVINGFPVFSENKILDGIHADSAGGQIVVDNNEITMRSNDRAIYIQGIPAEITNNKIVGGSQGIQVHGSPSSALTTSANIIGNTISECTTGIDVSAPGPNTIEKNLVFNNGVGISFVGNATIHHNTVTGNSVGIQCNPSQSYTITNNNIHNNSQYNLRTESLNDVTATNNWWGTTYSTKIGQSIYDNKLDFNLGTVIFVPFLTSPNPDAPTPTTTPSSTPTPTPTTTPSTAPTPSQQPSRTLQPEAIAGIAIMVTVLAAGTGLLIYKLKKK